MTSKVVQVRGLDSSWLVMGGLGVNVSNNTIMYYNLKLSYFATTHITIVGTLPPLPPSLLIGTT